MSEEIPEEETSEKQLPEIFRKIKSFFLSIFKSIERISNQVGAISLGFFRSPGLIFWSIILPVILLLLFGAIFGGSLETNYQLNVLDLDDSSESISFIAYLDYNTTLKINQIENITEEPIDWLKEGNRLILLIIPENWGNNLNQSGNASLIVYYDHSSTSAQSILQIVEEAVLERNFQIMLIPNVIGVEIENFLLTDLEYIDYLVPGIIMISNSIIVLISGLSYDIEEKQSGILKKFVSSPMFKFEWLFAKQIWLIILVFISSTISILFGLIFDFNISSLQPIMFVFVIFATLTFSGIAMIFVRAINNPEGVMFASVLFTIPQILLSGALIPLDTFPNFLLYVARIFPLFYLTEGMRSLMLELTQQFWINFAISAAFAVGIFTTGLIVTKWKQE
ncbi:MAG TPA: ABC transporter permease [candidate division Zixibacteria bacterium]|nr:ABC transporter permease [candidate division Zixibacteria bacterium]